MSTPAGELLRRVESIASSYFPREMSAAHDWFHVQRVRANAAELLTGCPDADPAIVHLAVLLHDIGRAKEDEGAIANHAAWGAEESEKLLREQEASEETIEAKIVSDADNLDALGAVGIARCFAHGGEIGSPIHDPSLPPEGDDSDSGRTQFNHLQKKILDLPERMDTEAGEELAGRRAGFVRRFIEEFDREVAETGSPVVGEE
ncbi:MAG: HD domain-containing protein [Halodesulfurarchaeum sp.]